MNRGKTFAASLLAQATAAWAGGDAVTPMALFQRAADTAEQQNDQECWVSAVLGLARGQQYNLLPGLLPVRLHAAYDAVDDPRLRAQLAAALARCWAYANEPRRAQPFALEAIGLT